MDTPLPAILGPETTDSKHYRRASIPWRDILPDSVKDRRSALSDPRRLALLEVGRPWKRCGVGELSEAQHLPDDSLAINDPGWIALHARHVA